MIQNLTDTEREQLAKTLGVTTTNLADAFAPHREAATEELARMYLGQRVFTRGTDMREYRLFLLIKYAFRGRVPSDAQISRLFQTTESQSRSLVRSVLSKYQYELESELNQSLRTLLAESLPGDPGVSFEFIVNSETLVDELNRRVQGVDGTLEAVSKVRGTASTYSLSPASFYALIELLWEPDPLPPAE